MLKFDDNSVQVKDALNDAAISFLEEAGGEIEAQTKRNCRVDTGKTKGSFRHVVNEEELICSIGSDYQNALWEEFGTGIYAVEGNGRKTPWVYKDADGKFHKTKGKKPKRMLFSAFQMLKGKIQRTAEERFSEL